LPRKRQDPPRSSAGPYPLPGVSDSLRQYVDTPNIADDYDAYFAFNALFDFDQQVVLTEFDRPGLVIDLGCGTGRALLPLLRKGFEGLAVDLSPHMLDIVRDKAALSEVTVHCLRANLTQLDAVRDRVADYAMCLFSTLGMIRPRSSRMAMLRHAQRVLKPGGKFIVHAHNFWRQGQQPSAREWLLAELFPWRRDGMEPGDRCFEYRGIPEMYLHMFRRRELMADLRGAGFSIVRVIPLDATRRHPLQASWFCQSIRANGWIVICQKIPVQ